MIYGAFLTLTIRLVLVRVFIHSNIDVLVSRFSKLEYSVWSLKIPSIDRIFGKYNE